MLSPKKLQYQQINKIITIIVVFMVAVSNAIIVLFIFILTSQHLGRAVLPKGKEEKTVAVQQASACCHTRKGQAKGRAGRLAV